MDIWKIAIDSSGNVQGQAENLGALVNSDQDEVTPFFHEVSSTLFFSSRGHGGIGGLDIFKSYFDRETGSYQLPVNMGEPINSSKDDAYMIWDTRLSRGYLSSDREPCDGGSCYAIYEVNNEPIHIYLSGYSYDKETAPKPQNPTRIKIEFNLMASKQSSKFLKVSVIADATIVTGMLLVGIGERTEKQKNFMIVDRETDTEKVKQFLLSLLERDDIGVVLITQNIAETVRDVILAHDKLTPTILEIPSKETAYDPEKDPIVVRAASILWGQETGMDKVKEMLATGGPAKV